MQMTDSDSELQMAEEDTSLDEHLLDVFSEAIVKNEKLVNDVHTVDDKEYVSSLNRYVQAVDSYSGGFVGKGLSSRKARLILHHGYVTYGKKPGGMKPYRKDLTPAQRAYFGARASGAPIKKTN